MSVAIEQHSVPFQGLLLRAFESRDAADFVLAAQESVATVGTWMPWCTPQFAEADALAWFAQCRRDLAAQQAHEFGVFDATTGGLLGGAGLNAISDQNCMCNLGYWVRQSAQRQGVALRVVQALLSYAFDTLGMQRVEIVVARGNLASEGVARKAGAQLECVARNRLQLHGQPVDASVFSMIPSAN